MRTNTLQATTSPQLPSSLSLFPSPALLIDRSGLIIAANRAAERMFASLEPVGLSLESLLELSGATGGAALFGAPDAASNARTRVQLADGRLIDLARAALPEGGAVISLFDVSAYIRDAELGSRDPLTGLHNRVGFLARLNDALVDTERSDSLVSVLCVDLDRFKTVNDALGHPVGDALLRKVADRLRSAARKGDVVARLGGDEFAIIQRHADQPQGAEALAARIVDLVGRAYVVSGHSINIGASIGIALSGDKPGADELIKRADLALYRAKASGRGQFCFYDPEMNALMQRRRLMELSLRRALALREFRLVFQPQFALASDTLVGFEALLRWHNEERGLVSPADFIPLAEEIGLMIPIGEWVLREACRQAAGWAQPLHIAVNLSAYQFKSPNLVELVASALAQAGLDPARLELEITETALLDNTESVLAALRGIRALGVKISMDDFGTGYSSLSYLQKFPFHKIKIDQSFVRRMAGDRESEAIVKAVAALGATLGMTTTAEGVETDEQLALVRSTGCTHVQGYLTGKPMPGEHAAALVLSSKGSPGIPA
ncbi:MAG: diguanylate cyclase [Caulobacterales bacterium 68-7]|nr:MAG: diguanylate cyclase [Caulobacterales bacterium 68-7]